MKNWNEANEGMIVYINDEIEMFDECDNLVGETKPYQKATIESVDSREIVVLIQGGKYDDYKLYFHPEEDEPYKLLTQEEYKQLKMTESKVWKDLNKFSSTIDKLKEKSEDILVIKTLIEKYNKK